MGNDSNDNAAVYNVLAFVFDGKDAAGQAEDELKSSGALDGYKIDAQATVDQDENGKVKIHEPGKGGVGAAVGAAAGGLLGLIGGPPGVLALSAAGAAVGGAAGHYFGRAIPKDDLEELGAALSPDSSALLMLLEDTQSEGVVNSMSGYDAQVVTLTVGDELSGQIAQYTEGSVSDAAGDVVAAEGGAAADAEGDVVAGGVEAAATGDDGGSSDSS